MNRGQAPLTSEPTCGLNRPQEAVGLTGEAAGGVASLLRSGPASPALHSAHTRSSLPSSPSPQWAEEPLVASPLSTAGSLPGWAADWEAQPRVEAGLLDQAHEERGSG